ncbi:hypothetical protein LPJ75_006795, partial [Coemansia sp. RSA 2598]
MRFSVIFLQALVAGALAAPMGSMMKRQEVSSSNGAAVSSGSSAVSNPNINNGNQIDSSLIVGGPAAGAGEVEAQDPGSAGDKVFADVMGASFTEINTNSANKDNIVANAHITTINGNEGETINGEASNIGDSQRIAGLVRRAAERKRDVV